MSVDLFSGTDLASNLNTLGTLANAFFANQNTADYIVDFLTPQNTAVGEFTGRQSQVEADIIGLISLALAGLGPGVFGPVVGIVAVIAGVAGVVYSQNLSQQIRDRNNANNNNNNDNTVAIVAAVTNPGVSLKFLIYVFQRCLISNFTAL